MDKMIGLPIWISELTIGKSPIGAAVGVILSASQPKRKQHIERIRQIVFKSKTYLLEY